MKHDHKKTRRKQSIIGNDKAASSCAGVLLLTGRDEEKGINLIYISLSSMALVSLSVKMHNRACLVVHTVAPVLLMQSPSIL
jgi:hypothetical protein